LALPLHATWGFEDDILGRRARPQSPCCRER
jgi:hypothetical protein